MIEFITENVPLGHCLQVEVLSEKNPVLHAQVVWSWLPADETEFTGQLMQDPAPSSK